MAVSPASAPRVAFFLATSGHSGVDRLMRNLIPAVARRGYAVDLLKVREHGPELGEAPGVRVIDLGSSHVWSSLPALIRYLRRERPRVMLSDKDKVNRCSVVARALAGASGSTRLVLRSGTTISVDLAHRGPVDRWIQRSSMRWLYRGAHAVVVPSDAAAQDMLTYTGLPPSLVRALPSPVLSADLFERRPPPPDHPWFAKDQPPVILGTGELSPRKDFATLVRAFGRLRAKGRSCRLVILGRGGQEAALKTLALELGVAHEMDLPGFREDVHAFMGHATAFALCSRWEGLGIVLVEAMACGTPVVSTDCPSGPRELLRDGVLGDLIDIGDDAALAAALERLLDRPRQPERYREAVRRYEIESATSGYLAAMGLPPQADEAAS